MQIQTIQDITSQKGYKVNNQFFVPYEGNSQYDRDNKDLLQILDWIKDGGIVQPEYTTEQLFEKAKQSKLAEIKQVKDMKLYEPVFYMNKYFVASERASSNIMGSILLDENTKWLDIDGNPINMTKQQMIELANAIKNQRGKIYFIEAQQSKAVENAKTIDDINKIIVNY